jgi:hypothetical protein
MDSGASLVPLHFYFFAHIDTAHLQGEHRRREEGHYETSRVDVPSEPGHLFCTVRDEGGLVSMEPLTAGMVHWP